VGRLLVAESNGGKKKAPRERGKSWRKRIFRMPMNHTLLSRAREMKSLRDHAYGVGVVGAVVEASSVGTIEELASVGTIEELASVMTVLDLKSLPTIFSPIAKAPATKNTHATIIDIGIMLLSKKSMPIPKRIAKEISCVYRKLDSA